MKSKWMWVLLLVLIGAAVYVGNVLATSSQGFTGTTVAKATFGEIDSHVVAEPGWQEKIKTQGASDLYVQQNTWDQSACGGCIPSSGWHTHPGPSLVIVTQGTVTEYDGDDPACTPHVYSAGGPNSFVDIGGGAVHSSRVARFRKRHDAARREGRLQRDRPPEQRPDQVPDKGSDRRSYPDDHIRPRRLQRLASRPGLRACDGEVGRGDRGRFAVQLDDLRTELSERSRVRRVRGRAWGRPQHEQRAGDDLFDGRCAGRRSACLPDRGRSAAVRMRTRRTFAN